MTTRPTPDDYFEGDGITYCEAMARRNLAHKAKLPAMKKGDVPATRFHVTDSEELYAPMSEYK